ncbi:hypothetical protein [Qipengyuania sp. DGS5-3]|uniref:hypothetical protein n=1 Tax=Qipengyuania sp. DGS5-3 TaxID=3349632 RepID=UPI0036D2A321
MRNLLPLIAFAAVASAPSALAHDDHVGATDAPYPAIEVLNAFRDGCGSIANQAAASASLTAAGWTEGGAFAPIQLVQFLTFAQDAGGEAVNAQGGTMSDMEVFEKTVAGERVFIVLSEIKVDGTRVSGCRLFDLGETRAIPAQTVTDWLGAEPIKSVDENVIKVHDWEPGLAPEHDSFQLFFVPNDSPFKAMVKFDGIAFKADTVGVED